MPAARAPALTENARSELHAAIENFVRRAAQPVAIDGGEQPLRLVDGQWSLSDWNGRMLFEAWDEQRNLARRITGVKEQRRERLVLSTERFPKAAGELRIEDLAAERGRETARRSGRLAFRERFRLMLAREFPEWRQVDLTVETNLEASLSPVYARALLRYGSGGIAVMAAPPECAEGAGIVTAGLIWLEYLRRREKALAIRRLLLFLPLGGHREAAWRARWIHPEAVECAVFGYDERDVAGRIDFADAGNMESSLPARLRRDSPNAAQSLLAGVDDVSRVEQSDGAVSLRIRGLEFARMSAGRLTCGIGRQTRATPETAAAMGREIARVRRADAEDRQHPLYTANPEGWLEAEVRANPCAIDASLLPAPLYGQVPVFQAADRGVIDLLGIDVYGRLAVIELKATAEPDLPLQALDYWMRVRRHLAAGDFERRGYFAGRTISREEPRILLVAPALEFHSTSEAIIGALRPEISVTRIGLASNWREQLRVMFCLRGAEKP